MGTADLGERLGGFQEELNGNSYMPAILVTISMHLNMLKANSHKAVS
jgi:hypothetical protein